MICGVTGNWPSREDLAESHSAGKRLNRGCAWAGTETSRGVTDIAAYRSKLRLAMPPRPAVRHVVITSCLGFRDTRQYQHHISRLQVTRPLDGSASARVADRCHPGCTSPNCRRRSLKSWPG